MTDEGADDNVRWFALPVNPEPWAVGPLDVIRRGGKLIPTMGQNPQLAAYKEAVAEEFMSRYGRISEALAQPNYMIDLYFWRNRARYTTPAQQAAARNDADATNMQKATEDALQGIAIDNDRNVVRVSSTVLGQGPDVKPGLLIKLQWNVNWTDLDRIRMALPVAPLLELSVAMNQAKNPGSNSWPPR